MLKNFQKDMEEDEETRSDCEIKKLENKQDSQVIANGPCPTG